MACGEEPAKDASNAPPVATTAPSTTAAATPSGPARMTRAQAKAAVGRGLGAVLQNVTIADDPVFLNGKFHGFKIVALRGALAGSGMQAGDVVTSVNKMPIEKPDQAFAAFKTLETAPALTVQFERNGTPQELSVPISE